MFTLHVDNTVHDFDSWKEVFDRYEDFRRSRGVRSYRVVRAADDPQRVLVDLDFDDEATAVAFRGALDKVWASPASREQLAAHREPMLLDVVVQRTL
ncbi:hypothetical protein FHP29_06165 [Nocardioides albidus]|uniref:Cyclase n=1 Tax=Nocardioides albidus TaxID=1517589 RepID=A0A5C4W4T5_9ACTN|nr:hypothetical protein [Nocardioides albidus]TNM43277.1 hypothetical protein FHP29_06165 [Nocardioides albidus]